MRNLARVLLSFAALTFVGVGCFIGGFFVGREMPATRPVAARPSVPTPTANALSEQFGLFWDVWGIVDSEYYDRQAIDYQKITYAAIRGMLDTLGDSHTTFSSPTVAQVSDDDLKGTFDGIGVQVEMKDGRLTVVAPIEGTPGERHGVRPGDYIKRIDDVDTDSLSLSDAVAKIRGPRGTIVRLTIVRAGAAEPILFELTREEIRPVNVRARMLDGDIAYLKLNSFTATSGEDVKAELAKLVAQNPKGAILDLRNNPGGLLLASVDVASQFLADGVVLSEEQRDGDPITYRAKPGGIATSLPLVVLINKGSASASEIVAGCLQDNGRAILVGENSFGKDSVQNVHRLRDNSSVRVTIAKWYTPKHQDIHLKGLKPDVAVALSETDAKEQLDPQLDQAREYLLEGPRN